MSQIRLRPLAEADLVERSRYYESHRGHRLGERFFDTAIELLEAIDERPGSGSLRIGELSGVPGLRSRKLPGFPCGWFYFERSDHIDVVRLLAYAQDLTTILSDAGQEQ